MNKLVLILLLALGLSTPAVAKGCDVVLKEGVSMAKVHPVMFKMLHGLSCLHANVFERPLVITSTTEGNHMKTSLHYLGLAVDVRTLHMKKPQLRGLVEELKLLYPSYTYVIEPTHLHIQSKGEMM